MLLPNAEQQLREGFLFRQSSCILQEGFQLYRVNYFLQALLQKRISQCANFEFFLECLLFMGHPMKHRSFAIN